MDPVPELGTLGVRQEYTLNGMPGHQKAPCARMHACTCAHTHTPRQFRVAETSNHLIARFWVGAERQLDSNPRLGLNFLFLISPLTKRKLCLKVDVKPCMPY